MDLYIEYIVRQYFQDKEWEVNLGSSGMNNTTRFLTIKDKEGLSKRYVLRVYESHQDKEKILFEHEVLSALEKRNMSFFIPQVVETLEGRTIATTSDGKLVSLAALIEGVNPRLDSKEQCYSLGKVVGEITKELGQVKIDQQPAYFAYYDLEASYPECPLDKVVEFCKAPPEGFDQEKLKRLGECFVSFQEVIPVLKRLPHQLSHGDINASNVLEDGERNICAVLDFEFVTQDLRVIDLAVCLSETINCLENEEALFDDMTSFIKGYLEQITLSDEEIEALPDLLMLRRLDVFIHFLVRYQDGISNNHISAEQILKDQIDKGITICDWVSANKEYIKSLCYR